MLRNDEEYKEYLEDIEPYHGDPVGYLEIFSVKRERSTLRYREIMLGTWPLLEEEKQLVYWIRQEASKGAKFSACLEGRSKSCIIKGAAVLFELGREKSAGKNGRQKDDTVFVEALEKVGVFQRLRSMTSAGLQGPQYVKLQFSRHHRQLRSRYELSLGMHLRDQLALGVTPSKVPHWTAFLSMLIGLFYNKTFRQKLEYLLEQISEVWLLPHWLDLANVEVLAADNTRVPLYMLMVAVHKELDSDDVPDGRFDIILLCRDSSREVGE
ncbi:AHG_G0043620.mRNA.1.CDS.1 [Saccharomyces cerevisiae]|nr:AHG_G0043620.mRNA.1.CDS.1 [Saccharomyces cerevisiae]CAI6850364.1 AHG_G0043620.mRNA.1.CDS.1 [Saccharomyces cerevisiae]